MNSSHPVEVRSSVSRTLGQKGPVTLGGHQLTNGTVGDSFLDAKVTDLQAQFIFQHVLVINAGVGNTNTVQYVEQFKIQRHATEPDVVIMQYYINDSEIIAKKPNNSIYRYSFFLAFLKQNLAALEYGVFRSRSLADYYARLYDDGAPGWLAVKESVRDLKAVAARNNMRLVILFIPDLHDFSKNSAFIAGFVFV